MLELLAPMWAERPAERQQFNGDHLAERFGLFTIIVLGEVVLSSTVAVREALDADGATVSLLVVAISGLVIAFGVWWAYFARNDVPPFDRFHGAFIWGYAHLPIFGGLAAFGAGVHVAIGAAVGHGEHVPTQRLAALAVTVPLAVGATGLATVVATSGSRHERPTAFDPARHGRPAPRGWAHLVGQAGDRRDGDRRDGRHDRAGPARPPHVRGGAGMTYEASIEADVRRRVAELSTAGVEVIECDPSLADTAQFCAAYGYAMEDSANAIVVIGKSDPPVYAMCVVLATTRLDVNKVVRKRLGTKKASFASGEDTEAADRHDDRRRDPVRRARRPADLGRRRRHGLGIGSSSEAGAGAARSSARPRCSASSTVPRSSTTWPRARLGPTPSDRVP